MNTFQLVINLFYSPLSCNQSGFCCRSSSNFNGGGFLSSSGWGGGGCLTGEGNLSRSPADSEIT